ncbi:MAG: CBS domain-containing protein [Bacteroidota bacterium]
MLVKAILKAKARGAGVVTVSPDMTVAEAARSLATHRIGAVVAVEDGGNIAGILSERDIVRGVALQGEGCLRGAVRDLMTAAVLTCREEDSVESLMQIMTSRRIRHLPVVDGDNRLTGIVTIGDVVKSRLDEADMEVDNLRHYVVAAR